MAARRQTASGAPLAFLQSRVYELTIQSVFSAAHALVIRGVREPLHGHDWQVTVAVTGGELDADGLLVDFHDVERVLSEVVAPFRNANLNEIPPFDRVNPSAENVAAYIAAAVAGGLGSGRPGSGEGGARVAWARVTEAPGCAVLYRVGADAGRTSGVGVGRGTMGAVT